MEIDKTEGTDDTFKPDPELHQHMKRLVAAHRKAWADRLRGLRGDGPAGRRCARHLYLTLRARERATVEAWRRILMGEGEPTSPRTLLPNQRKSHQ